MFFFWEPHHAHTFPTGRPLLPPTTCRLCYCCSLTTHFSFLFTLPEILLLAYCTHYGSILLPVVFGDGHCTPFLITCSISFWMSVILLHACCGTRALGIHTKHVCMAATATSVVVMLILRPPLLLPSTLHTFIHSVEKLFFAFSSIMFNITLTLPSVLLPT